MKYKIFLVIGVFFVSFAAIFVKLIDGEPSVIAMYRLGIGGLLLLPFALKKQTIKNIKFHDFKFIILAGLVISLHYLTWFTSLKLTSVASATLIICTEPLVALGFSYFLYKEKIPIKQFMILLVALIGVGIVARGDIYLNKDAIIGDLLTFIAVIFFVVYLLISEKVVKKYSFITYTSLLFITAGLILLIYNLIMGYELKNFDSFSWIMIILIAIIPNIGQLIFNYVLNYVKPSLIASGILLEPIFASILAVIILKDTIYSNQLIGGTIIIISVYFYIKFDTIKKTLK